MNFSALMIVYAVIVTLDGNLLVPLLFLEVMDLTHLIIFDFMSSSFWGGMGERILECVFFAIP